MKTKLVFFGSSEFSTRILKKVAADFEVVLVVTQPDKPVGRKQELTETSVAQQAALLGLPVIKPQKLKDPEVIEKIRSAEPDLYLVVAYGKIISQALLDIPKLGAINIHGSLLPNYRGAAPIHAALLNGDAKTGITIMLMDSEMDHGPVLLEAEVEIGPNEIFPELSEKLADLAELIIAESIQKFISGKLKPRPQDHAKASFTKIITKDDGKIIWNQSAQQIYNQYRAYISWPGVWTIWNGKALKITKTKPAMEPTAHKPGSVFSGSSGELLVACGTGALELAELQLEGKKNMAAKEFLNGHQDFIGSVLG